MAVVILRINTINLPRSGRFPPLALWMSIATIKLVKRVRARAPPNTFIFCPNYEIRFSSSFFKLKDITFGVRLFHTTKESGMRKTISTSLHTKIKQLASTNEYLLYGQFVFDLFQTNS